MSWRALGGAVDARVRDEPFVKAGPYATVNLYAFENLWPQRAGFLRS